MLFTLLILLLPLCDNYEASAGPLNATRLAQNEHDTYVTSHTAPPQPLPGEEITTNSGKKMKIWSTVGPVPVSRAPEPFEDPSDRRINQNVDLYVDGDKLLDRNQQPKPTIPTHTVPGK